MTKNIKLWVAAIALSCGVLTAYPAMAFDETKCTTEVGTAFNGQKAGRFCISNAPMNNWFMALSWCQAIGGHLATRDEACNNEVSNCSNITVSGRTGNIWLADPKGSDQAYYIVLPWGSLDISPRSKGTLAALCK